MATGAPDDSARHRRARAARWCRATRATSRTCAAARRGRPRSSAQSLDRPRRPRRPGRAGRGRRSRSVPGGELGLIELARRAEASDLGAGTVELLQVSADRLCRDYPTVDPRVLSDQARTRLGYVTGLLGKRVTLAQHRDLLVIAGWLSALLACTCYDAGDPGAAETARRMTRQFGEHAGHGELVAWSFEIAAWYALVEGRTAQAVALCEAGLSPCGHQQRRRAAHPAGQPRLRPDGRRPGGDDAYRGRGGTCPAPGPRSSRAPFRVRPGQVRVLHRDGLHLARHRRCRRGGERPRGGRPLPRARR